MLDKESRIYKQYCFSESRGDIKDLLERIEMHEDVGNFASAKNMLVNHMDDIKKLLRELND